MKLNIASHQSNKVFLRSLRTYAFDTKSSAFPRSPRMSVCPMENCANRSDEGLTLETSAFLPFTEAN